MAEPPRSLLGALLGGVSRALVQTRAAAIKVLGAPSPVQTPRPLHQQYLYAGVQDPDDVAALMRLADTGYIYHMHDFWEEQRNKDCHLGTCAYRREHAVATLPWQMIAASELPRDLRIAAWVEDVLRRIGDHDHKQASDMGLDPVGLRDLTVHMNGACTIDSSSTYSQKPEVPQWLE